MDNSPIANADLAQVAFQGERIAVISDPSRFVTIADAMRAGVA